MSSSVRVSDVYSSASCAPGGGGVGIALREACPGHPCPAVGDAHGEGDVRAPTLPGTVRAVAAGASAPRTVAGDGGDGQGTGGAAHGAGSFGDGWGAAVAPVHHSPPVPGSRAAGHHSRDRAHPRG